MHAPGIGGVVVGGEPPAADAGRVVMDVEHRPARGGPLDRADQPAWLHPQPALLMHLPHHRLRIALARVDPAARQRPPPRLRLVPGLDQQQPPGVVGDDGADAPDPRYRHPPSIVLSPPGYLTRARGA